MKVKNSNSLKGTIRQASSVVGIQLDSKVALVERRVRSRLKAIMDNGHPLPQTFIQQTSFSGRPKSLSCSIERLNMSFVGPSGYTTPPLVGLKEGRRTV